MVEDFSATKSIAKGAGLVFIGLVIGRLLGYITRLIVARYFGPADYGILVLALSVFSITSVICLLGLQGGLLRFVPEFVGRGQDKKIRPAAYYALKISTLLSILIAIIVFFSAGAISDSVFHEARLAAVLQIIIISMPFNVAASVFVGVIMGLKHAKYRVYIDDITKPLSRVVFLLAAVILGSGIAGAAASYTISFLISALGGFYLIHKLTRRDVGKLSHKEKRGLLSYSWPMMFTSIIFIIMGQIDSLMIGFFKIASDVGVYNSALPTVEIMTVIPVSVMALFLPVISELYERSKVMEVGELYKRVVKWILMLLIPFFAGFILFSGHVLNILFGQQYLSGALALSVLSIGYFVSSVLYPSYDIINLHKKTKIHIYISLLSMWINVILNYFLIPVYGIVGAAAATSFSYVILASVMTIIAYKISGFSPNSHKSAGVIVVGVISVMFLYLALVFWGVVSLFASVLLFMAFLVVYITLLLVFRTFDKDDLAIVKSVQEKTGIRIGIMNKIIKGFVDE